MITIVTVLIMNLLGIQIFDRISEIFGVANGRVRRSSNNNMFLLGFRECFIVCWLQLVLLVLCFTPKFNC